jgi:hypothetical protein
MLPRYYQTAIAALLRFVLAMLVLALVAGILYAESAKKVPLDTYTLQTSFHANYLLSLLHGHTFMFGVFIPLAIILLWVLPMWLLQTPAMGPVLIRLTTWLYMPSALVSVGLLIYKAYAVQLMVRAGNSDFAAIEHALFAGNHLLRVLGYALPHTGFGVALLCLVIGVGRSLKGMRLTQNP